MTSKNKLNLIIDFNNISFRALFTCTYASEYEVSTFDTNKECEILVRKIATDLSFIIREFVPDNVIIVCDAKHPWRNKLYDNIPGETYKGNRVKDENKNWTKIFNSLDDLKNILKNKGFTVTEINNAEADDLAALYKNYLSGIGESMVLVSSDKDWTQLVSFDQLYNQFCIVYNPIPNNKGKKKIFINVEFNNWLNQEENKNDIFFNNTNTCKKRIISAKSKDKIETSVIDPENVLLEKIICGDTGDNVPGFYEFYKNGKRWRITPLRMNKIFESAHLKTIDDLKTGNNINNFIKELEIISKHTVDDIDPNDRLLRQRKLVELNIDLFPSEIVSEFNKQIQNFTENCSVNTSTIKMEDILSGTKYVSNDYKKSKENSIFKELQNLDYLIERNTKLF